MILRTLKLTQYRNYSQMAIDFDPLINALTGMNGVGKTNVLDAIYHLCLGKSYFTNLDKHIFLQDHDFFRLEADFIIKDNLEKVVVKSKAGGRKEIEISGKKLPKVSDHVGRFLSVIIAPDDVKLLMESSEDRRNFLNNTIVQTDKSYLEDLMLYNALLKRRNSLLKTFALQNKSDDLLLESVSNGMYGPAQRIFEKRRQVTEHLRPLFNEIYADISGQREACDIVYESQLAFENLQSLMQTSKNKDIILARTTKGIHKDDLIFTMNGSPLGSFASQGQLKSFVMALKLTQYKLLQNHAGENPILLLDDIFDKLDAERVRHLLTLLIHQNFGQIFITDTQPDRIKKILDEIGNQYRLFHVENGRLNNS